MKTKKWFILILIAFLIFEKEVRAQEIWNLKKCIEVALQNNLQIKQSELNNKLSEYSKKQSVASYLPTLNANSSWANSFGRSVDPFTNQFTTNNVVSTNFSLSGNLTLFNGFTKYYTYKKAISDLEKSKYDLEKTKNDISLAVASGYLQILMLKESLKQNESRLEITLQQLERVKLQVESGVLPISSQLEIESQLANDRFNFSSTKSQYEISLLNLAQLIDLENTQDFEIESTDIQNIISNTLQTSSEIFEESKTKMPQILSAKYSVESSLYNYKNTRSNYYPTLSLGAVMFSGTSSQARKISSFNSGFFPIGNVNNDPSQVVYVFQSYPEYANNYSFSDQINENFRQQISLSLNIPILNGFATRIATQQSKINYEISKLNENIALNQLRKEIEQAVLDVETSFINYESSKKMYETNKELLKFSELRYNNGATSFTELNINRQNYINAESVYISAKYDYLFKTKVLDFYKGNFLIE